MSITSQNTAKPNLAVEVFLALDEIQALGPRLQYMASWSAPKTAIIWRDGKLCYEGFTSIEQVHFTDGILIGSVNLTPGQTSEWSLATSVSIEDPSQPLREVWIDLLTGKRSELAGTMLAVGVIPADYDLGELGIDAGSFVFATRGVSEDKMSGSYVRIFESQLEEICVPLAVTRLTTSEARSVITKIWFDTDVTSSDFESAIDKLGRLTTISESLQLAHNNIERALI
jgi:hypothetical protein